MGSRFKPEFCPPNPSLEQSSLVPRRAFTPIPSVQTTPPRRSRLPLPKGRLRGIFGGSEAIVIVLGVHPYHDSVRTGLFPGPYAPGCPVNLLTVLVLHPGGFEVWPTWLRQPSSILNRLFHGVSYPGQHGVSSLHVGFADPIRSPTQILPAPKKSLIAY